MNDGLIYWHCRNTYTHRNKYAREQHCVCAIKNQNEFS